MAELLIRPSWDAIWMQVADTISKRSRCVGAQVGCVIVDAGQSVLAVSYNGPPPRYKVTGSCSSWCPRARGEGGRTGDYSNCPSVHAEVNAAARADHSRIVGATAYSTRASCMGCAKTLAASGIVRLVHRVDDSDAHRNPEISELFLQQSGIEVVRWTAQ